MASSVREASVQKAGKTPDSCGSVGDFFDQNTISESEDHDGSPHFGSEREDSANRPGSSRAVRRVSTSLGQDSIPPAQQRVHFCPKRAPGAHLGIALRSGAAEFGRALDFFQLFFTTEVINKICESTNKYAWRHILEKSAYAEKDGSWKEVTVEEMTKFIGILIYMGIVELPRLHLFWNSGSLFSGLLPPKVMTRSRFFALLGMFHVSDPDADNVAAGGKLDEVLWLLQHTNDTSTRFFQPHRDLSIDERMVTSKARPGIRQHARDMLTKRGYRLWILADSQTGYTVQFSVYKGRREMPSTNGLAFDVVTGLCRDYLDQGYTIFMDNFYTSTPLFKHLLERGTFACGTTRKDRRGFPPELKDAGWERDADRGDVRWLREHNVLYLQWKDRHVVNLMSTAHTANEHVPAKHREKKGDEWTEVTVKKPLVIAEHSRGMAGADKSGQLIGSYDILIRCVRWWKTLFFRCVDIAAANSFLLFQEHRKQHPELPQLSRPSRYDQLAFRIELVQQLVGLAAAAVDVDVKPAPKPPASRGAVRSWRAAQSHRPERLKKRCNCKMCYEKTKVERKTNVFCKACCVHLCFTSSRNCFADWHGRQEP
ncbi:piggyBac transposable element-derived protein 4-like [Ornithodoros turicata]|uniref:piggyBac transposable element-derived protein 4-like n=1 Tax=Ornithodoros turicata TaxID=34597 RepID=UPI003139A052